MLFKTHIFHVILLTRAIWWTLLVFLTDGLYWCGYGCVGVRIDVVDFSVGRNERRITSKIIIGEFTGFSINLIFCRVEQRDLQGDAGCLQSVAA